ncbi:class I SAM-dependent methyltransferase [Streptosporangium sp. KLBMP 9127]|nr:class I SAM-dependent methyltransferase [Streptosporangium sp. KLBMP 9127]
MSESPNGRPPVLANLRYREHADALNGLGVAETFAYIHHANLWGSEESTSGVGSELDATATLREQVPALLDRVGARSLLDLPCGDFGWLSTTPLPLDSYVGADIVPDLVERNSEKYSGPGRAFTRLDLTADPLPRADVVLCRDCLVHLTYDQIFAAFANLRLSGSRRLLTTTFVDLTANHDIAVGDWRPLNLELPPFGLPEPLEVIIEGCSEEGGAYADKALGLWDVSALPG